MEQRRVALGMGDHVLRPTAGRPRGSARRPRRARRERWPRRSVKRSISSARVSVGGRCCTSSRPPQGWQRGCGSSSRRLVAARDADLPALRPLGLEFHALASRRLSISRAPTRSTARHPRRRSACPAAAYAAIIAAATRSPAARPRVSANAVGPPPEIELPERARRERRRLRLGEPRAAGRRGPARRCGRRWRGRAARSRRARAPPRSRRPGPPGAARRRAAPPAAARPAPRRSAARCSGRTSTTMSSSGTGSCTMSGGSMQRMSTMPPSSDGAMLSRWRPATVSSATRQAASSAGAVERRAQQRVRGDGAGHRRRRAPALAARERQPLPHRRARCRARP